MRVDCAQGWYELRDLVAKDLLKNKHPKLKFTVHMPAYQAVALKMLEHLRRPPSREGVKPMELEYDFGSTVQTTSIQLDHFEDIAWALQLHLVREDQMFGAMVFKKGRASNHTVFVCGPPAVFM